jgi:hypothetical protein
VEISTLAIRLQIRHDSNPATVTPLLRWLSTKHNLIERIEEHKQEGKNTQSEIPNMNDANINRGFKNSVPKD